MKRITSLLFAVFMLSAFTIKGDPEKDILGKWKVDDASVGSAKKAMIERVRKINAEQAEQMAGFEGLDDIIKGLVYEYKADGTLDVSAPQGSQSMKWAISADHKYLSRTREDGTSSKDSIISIKPERLIFADEGTKEKIEFVKAQ